VTAIPSSRLRLDTLLEKFGRDELIPVETEELKGLLLRIMNGVAEDFIAGDRVAAAIMLRFIEQAKTEKWLS